MLGNSAACMLTDIVIPVQSLAAYMHVKLLSAVSKLVF